MTTTARSTRAPAKAGARADAHRPHGEEQVRLALVSAAAELFAQRGPSAVTVRHIAEAAGVNHGLVHHYFGSKDGLLTAVLDLLATQAAEEIAAAPGAADLLNTGGPAQRHARILAFVLLEGRDPAELKTGFPAVEALVAGFRSDGLGLREARERAAQVTALVLGWQLFEPFLAGATGLDVTPRTRGRILNDAIARVTR